MSFNASDLEKFLRQRKQDVLSMAVDLEMI